MKRNDVKVLAIFLVLFHYLACSGDGDLSGTEIGNPNTVALSIVGVDTTPSARMAIQSLSNGITLTSARIVFSNIEFVPAPAEGCLNEGEESDEVKFAGPFVVNLLTNLSVPDLGQVEVLAGTYCEIELKLKRLEPDTVPSGIASDDEIINQSFIFRGTLQDNTPFLIRGDLDEEFELESSVGIQVSAEMLTSLVVALYMDDWFAGVDLASADQVGGEIVLDKDNNQSMLQLVEDNIKQSARLFEDRDYDGELDEDESSDDDILAEGKEID